MKKIKTILIFLAIASGLGTLAACSSTAAPSTDNTSVADSTSNTDTSTSVSSSSVDQSSSASSSSDLTQSAVYKYLQEAGYTGLADQNFQGFSNGVQSQSMNYVYIGQITDVAQAEQQFVQLKDINPQVGQWVYYTDVKVGTLNSLSDLSNIQ